MASAKRLVDTVSSLYESISISFFFNKNSKSHLWKLFNGLFLKQKQKLQKIEKFDKSFYNLVVRDNLQLRSACTHRYFLNDTIDAWKMEHVESGNPPRNVTRSNIIHQLQRQWGFIVSIEDDTVVWKEDVARNKESASFNDMLTALMSGDAASLNKS